jgi:prolyl-tRNA editing enzyme YbaK/EbsC (Cys-tRNA(Pro) deacylase)
LAEAHGPSCLSSWCPRSAHTSARTRASSKDHVAARYLCLVEPAGQDAKIKAVVGAAQQLGLDIVPITFPQGTRTAQDAADAIGCDVAQIVKSLVFLAGDRAVLFLVSGANRLDLERAAAVAGVEKLVKADATAVKRETGYSIGATPPFGHAQYMPMFMDEDLLHHDEVWAAAGRTDAVFAVDPKLLRGATGAAVARLGWRSR